MIFFMVNLKNKNTIVISTMNLIKLFCLNPYLTENNSIPTSNNLDIDIKSLNEKTLDQINKEKNNYNQLGRTPDGYRKNNNDSKISYKKIEILNPYLNRSKIAEVAKGAKGVYIFENNNKDIKYVGSSINLYNRVCSYFLPAILTKADRKVIRYFNKYGFKDITLTLLILDSNSTGAAERKEIIKLEQDFINSLSPNLNVDFLAGGYSGYHTPMAPEARTILRKLRGTPVYIYDTTTKSLIFISESKQILRTMGIYTNTINRCLMEANLYLNRFFLSTDFISEFPFEALINEKELESLINKVRFQYKPNQPKSKKVLAENTINSNLNRTFSSLHELSKHLKGDRSTIRNYMLGKMKGLYRNQWKFTEIETDSNKII